MQCHFFALGSDLSPVFEVVELAEPLHYVLFGHQASKTPATYLRGATLPSLAGGIPRAERNSERQYLVAFRRSPFEPRRIRQGFLRSVYAFDQLVNPHTVVLAHGVIAADGVLLPGSISTCSDGAESVQLQKRFAGAVRKHFVRVNAYWVGPAAHLAWEYGWRLTLAPESAREYDLTER